MQSFFTILLAVMAPSGILVTLIEKTRRENNRDHAKNGHILEKIDNQINQVQNSVDRVGNRLDDHISWHLLKQERKKK